MKKHSHSNQIEINKTKNEKKRITKIKANSNKAKMLNFLHLVFFLEFLVRLDFQSKIFTGMLLRTV